MVGRVGGEGGWEVVEFGEMKASIFALWNSINAFCSNKYGSSEVTIARNLFEHRYRATSWP